MRRIYGSIAVVILSFCNFIQGMPTMTSSDLILMPYPAEVQLESGAFRLDDDFRIAVEGAVTPRLERAIARRGMFSLIEVMLPRGATSRTLARFVTGLKSARDRQAG